MKKLLVETADRAARYIAEIASRRVVPLPADVARLETLGGPLPQSPSDPAEVLALLDDIGSPATVATAGGRYFSGVLILLFGFGMTIALGVKSALDFSVFAASAAGFGLAALESYPWSIDSLRSSRPGLRPRTDSA